RGYSAHALAAPHAPGHALLAATALTSAANAQLSGVSTAGYTAGYTAKSRNNGAFPPLVPERVGFEPTERLPVQPFSRPLRGAKATGPRLYKPKESHDQDANNAGCESPQPPTVDSPKSFLRGVVCSRPSRKNPGFRLNPRRAARRGPGLSLLA